jgi:hypothetical protein
MAQRRGSCGLFSQGAACSRSSFLHRLTTWNAPNGLLTNHPTCHFYSSFNYHHQPSLASTFMFSLFLIISHHSTSKMGPFYSFKSIRVPHLRHSPRFPPKTIINRIVVLTEINQVPTCQLENVSAIFNYMRCRENIEKGESPALTIAARINRKRTGLSILE